MVEQSPGSPGPGSRFQHDQRSTKMRFDEDVFYALRAEARRRDVSLQALVRAILRAWLAEFQA